MGTDGPMVRLARASYDLLTDGLHPRAIVRRKELAEYEADLKSRIADLAGEVVVYGCDVEGHPNNYTHTHTDPLAKAREADRLLRHAEIEPEVAFKARKRFP